MTCLQALCWVSLIIPLIADRSKWVVLMCGTLEEMEKLLAVKIMWLKKAKLFVMFRKIHFKPYLIKFIQLVGLSTPELWEKALAALHMDGVEITPTAPKIFEPNYTERILWKIEHRDEHWVFCSSEDHFHTPCAYTKLVVIFSEVVRATVGSEAEASRK